MISLAGNKNNINKEKYSQVRIYSSGETEIKKIIDAGLLIDHSVRKPGYTNAWLSEGEINLLRKSGIPYKILVDDWEKYYKSFPAMTYSQRQNSINKTKELYNVSHSIYGSMGGFLTYDEVTAKLDSMRLEYPHLISNKFSIGTTVEGRQMWTVRVTKNPNSPTGKPEIWYHSLIHAREPESMEHVVFYIYWLLENYNIDPIATYILNNREIYFTPVFNPDGYVYNQTTNPDGGGLWRKNRKDNGNSFGVDLNRNYGTYQFWDSPNNGSSIIPDRETYRGVSPFSEPETQAAMNFIGSRKISAVMSSHTFGNYIIKPWNWSDPQGTPDDHKYSIYLSDMTKHNRYLTGTSTQTLGYFIRGNTDDWYYNDSIHKPHKIIAITPEVGTTGFWPAQAEIIPLAEEMLFPNQYFSMLAGAYVYPVNIETDKITYNAGDQGILKIKFQNKGLKSAQNVKIECTSQSHLLNIPMTYFTYANMNSFQSDSSVFGFSLSPFIQNNSAIPVKIEFKLNDSNLVYREIKFILIGSGTVSFSDSAEQGLNNWITNQGWAATQAQYHSALNSFTDSPLGNYTEDSDNSLTLNIPLDISNSPVTFLSFWHKYTTEPGYDFCYVEVSDDNGTTWQKAATYSGTLNSWTPQVFDITSYANASFELKIRFRLDSDEIINYDGWYVDDIKITNYNITTDNPFIHLNLSLAQEGFYDTTSNALSIKDTVNVYLKHGYPPYSTADSAKGVIDSLTFNGIFQFSNAPSGNYYIVVNHRNSIETWSKSVRSFTRGDTANYDFTLSAEQAFGNNLQLKGAKYCIYTGDVNQDGAVTLSDALITYNDAQNFLIGYLNSDVNGNNSVELLDVIAVYNNVIKFVSRIVP